MHTKAIEKMDYEKANGVRDALIALNKNDPLFNEKKFFFEGIFLDLTDRTEKHPQIPIITKKKEKGFLSNLQKEFSGGNDPLEIQWVYNEEFNLEEYFSSNWFDPSISTNSQLENDLNKSKDLYKSKKIDFFQFFIKRMDVYENVEPSNFIKWYTGVDLNKYKKKLREIFEPIL